MNQTTPSVPSFERPTTDDPEEQPAVLPPPAETVVDPWSRMAPEAVVVTPEPNPASPWPSPAPAPAPAPPDRPRRAVFDGRMRRAAGLAALALLAGAAGSALTLALYDDAVLAGGRAATGTPAPAVGSSSLSGDALDVAGVVAAVEPATVSIEVTYGGGPFGRSATGAGTGVIVTADGEVLTNAHVVEGASQIRVTLAGESRPRQAELVGSDRSADLALLRINGASGLPTAQLGSSSQVRVGDDVVAIGNALGLRGGPTVTRGIISAIGRSLDTDAGTMTGMIQTDASISSGNSGGPLVNALGQVVAINTAVATGGRSSSAENIGFAIPTDKALPVVERLRSGTTASALAYLGVRTSDPLDGSRGAVVVSVDTGSPAAEAGIRAGDLVTHVAGKSVAGAAELGGLVGEHQPGEQVDVSVIRDDDKVTVEVTLGTRR